MRGLIGRTLGHYRIVEKIGEGGMGEVYRAHDERLDRDVAVKVLPEDVATDAGRLRRFESEAKAVAQLDHPNILAIHDFRAEDGVAYAVMELLEGESLRELISEGSITTGKAVEYARAIADGLAAAHDKGIVHRDLKPENVFLTKDGRIKILDFGLAKLKIPDEDLTTETPTATLDTAPGGLIGTVPYMAPEQVQGQPADHRSDIFALGVVLYEILTGHRPFGGSTTVETAAAILKEDPEPISVAAPAVSPALGSVVSKCLEKRPEDRFSSAHDLALTLGAVDSVAWHPPTQDRSSIGKRWPHILAVVIAAAIALFFIFPPKGLFERLAEQPPEVSIPRIVVLPFENLGSPDDEYFADGMTEEIISRLSAVSGLLVISRTSAMQYKSTEKAVRQIGEELNVQYALEGTVRWERTDEGQGRVRITPQLINVADDTHLWSDRYDRELGGILAVQDDIARSVAEVLRVTLLGTRESAGAPRTVHPEAYTAYLRGRYFHNRLSEEDLKNAVRYFEKALALDPDFAPALADLSGTVIKLAGRGHIPMEEGVERAREAATRALQLDRNLADAWANLAWIKLYFDWDWAGSEAAFRKALELEPGNATAVRGAAALAAAAGRFEECIPLDRRAVELDPLSIIAHRNLGGHAWYAGLYDEAVAALKKGLELSPEQPGAHLLLGRIYLSQSQLQTALEEIEKEPDDFWRLYGYALAYHALGQEAEASEALRTLIEEHAGHAAYQIAEAYAFRGEVDETLSWLEHAYEGGDPGLAEIRGDPMFSKLEDEPRFQDILRRMNFPED